MKEFIWHLRCMYSSKKYAKINEQCRNEYQWYKYLVYYRISSFFNRFKFWKRKGDLPF
jgi:hypothetical protein